MEGDFEFVGRLLELVIDFEVLVLPVYYDEVQSLDFGVFLFQL